jgi:hypothetical protein
VPERRVGRQTRLSSISQPVLLITRAEQDAAVSDIAFVTAAADAVARLIENARRITVPAPTHVVDPEALAPALTNFFGSPWADVSDLIGQIARH